MSEISGLAEVVMFLNRASAEQLRAYAADVRAFASSQKSAERQLLVEIAAVVDRMAEARK